jgi:hypothetical protein
VHALIVRQKYQMETIDRLFRPGFWRLSVPLLIVSTFMLFLTSLLSTLFEANHPRAAVVVGVLFGGYALAAVSLFMFMILTRLRLHSDGLSLDASLSLSYSLTGWSILILKDDSLFMGRVPSDYESDLLPPFLESPGFLILSDQSNCCLLSILISNSFSIL